MLFDFSPRCTREGKINLKQNPQIQGRKKDETREDQVLVRFPALRSRAFRGKKSPLKKVHSSRKNEKERVGIEVKRERERERKERERAKGRERKRER